MLGVGSGSISFWKDCVTLSCFGFCFEFGKDYLFEPFQWFGVFVCLFKEKKGGILKQTSLPENQANRIVW